MSQMSQQVGSAVFHKKRMDNEYQVIFFPDNGKSWSMVDKTTKTGYDNWRGGQLGRVKKSDLWLGFPLSNLYQSAKLVSNLTIHM